MDCSLPPALTDQQLLAALDGTADQQVIQHVQQCRACEARSQTLAELQTRLQTRLLRATCPSSLELGEFFLRRLPAPQRLVISQHVRQCPHCTRELGELVEAFGTEALQIKDDAPENLPKILTATLLSGTAGALRGENKVITLQVDEAVLTFDVQSAPRGMISLLGQIAAEDQDLWTGAVVTLLQDGSPRQTASVSDLGSFHFSAIQPGETRMTITSLHDVIIQVPPLILKT